MTSMGILEATLIHGIIDHFSAPFPYTMAPSIAIPISIGGIKIITDHYDLRGRLERSCQESGYTERVFELTTKAWCNRQIARIVAKRYGKLQEYEDLCKKNRATSAFPNVPHF